MGTMTSMFALAPMLALAACGSNQDHAPPPDPTPTPTPTTPPAPTATPTVLTYEGLATPESVLWDAASDRYLVSNIDGSPFAKDDNGFIAALSPDGSVESLRFIDGAADGVTLNAPKGMAIAGDHLFVADIDTVRVFDRATGAPAGEIAIEGATFLNDVAAGPDGTVYVSDSGLEPGEGGFAPSGTDAIYRVALGQPPVPLARDAGLGHPNGLCVVGDALFVVTLGTGELYRLTDGQKADAHALPQGQLDGIVPLADGSLLVSSWEASGVYRGRPGGEFTLVVEGATSPADIGYDAQRHRLLVPLFTGDAVHVYDVR